MLKQGMLFNTDDLLKDVTINETGKNMPSQANRKKSNRFASQLGKRFQKVQEVIGDISMGDNIHFVSAGEWSAHDILVHILDQTGPADVYVATWSFTEIAAQILLKQIKLKKIRNIYLLMDWRVKVRTPQVLDLLSFNISTIRLTQCHAKVTAIVNDTWGVGIVGSANYTNNPRIEAGVISCDRDLAEFHRNWIKDCIDKLNPFEFKANETK